MHSLPPTRPPPLLDRRRLRPIRPHPRTRQPSDGEPTPARPGRQDPLHHENTPPPPAPIGILAPKSNQDLMHRNGRAPTVGPAATCARRQHPLHQKNAPPLLPSGTPAPESAVKTSCTRAGAPGAVSHAPSCAGGKHPLGHAGPVPRCCPGVAARPHAPVGRASPRPPRGAPVPAAIPKGGHPAARDRADAGQGAQPPRQDPLHQECGRPPPDLAAPALAEPHAPERLRRRLAARGRPKEHAMHRDRPKAHLPAQPAASSAIPAAPEKRGQDPMHQEAAWPPYHPDRPGAYLRASVAATCVAGKPRRHGGQPDRQNLMHQEHAREPERSGRLASAIRHGSPAGRRMLRENKTPCT
jgi:hypothetical protein